ncbi:Protoglobin-domain-containing protein [Zopfochytrium polystomum]|nr:Protoglobin-domain-containing protein [Zopfochytrium polystomum]
MSTSKFSVIDPTRLDARAENRLYRFNYVASFCNFGAADIAAIHAAAGAVAPLVPAIVDAVYAKLFEFDVTREFFVVRNEGFHGKTAGSAAALTGDDEQIRYRKSMLNKYLVKLVTAEYDEKFVDYIDWVGRIHTTVSVGGQVKKSRINVDYVHVNALFGYVSSFIVEALLGAGLPKDVETKTVLAFNKLLWIQNDFFAKYYTTDSLERSGASVQRGNNAAGGLLSSSASLPVATAALVAAVAVGFIVGKQL